MSDKGTSSPRCDTRGPGPRPGRGRSLHPVQRGEEKNDALRALERTGGAANVRRICHALSRSLPNATRYDKICKSSPPRGYSSAFSRRARTAPHRTAPHCARSQLRPPAEHGPCLHRTVGAWAGGKEEVDRVRRRATNVPLPAASASRGRVRDYEPARLAAPRNCDRGGGDGARRAAPRRFPPPPTPLSRRATRSFTSLAGERYTFFHFALLYQPPLGLRRFFARPDFFRRTQGRLPSAGNKTDKLSEAITTRPRA